MAPFGLCLSPVVWLRRPLCHRSLVQPVQPVQPVHSPLCHCPGTTRAFFLQEAPQARAGLRLRLPSSAWLLHPLEVALLTVSSASQAPSRPHNLNPTLPLPYLNYCTRPSFHLSLFPVHKIDPSPRLAKGHPLVIGLLLSLHSHYYLYVTKPTPPLAARLLALTTHLHSTLLCSPTVPSLRLSPSLHLLGSISPRYTLAHPRHQPALTAHHRHIRPSLLQQTKDDASPPNHHAPHMQHLEHQLL